MGGCTDLIGLFFLTFDDEGNLDFHGEILERLEPGYFLCQLFSALTGEPTNSIIRSVRQMVGWEFFDDAKLWHRAYANASSRGRR